VDTREQGPEPSDLSATELVDAMAANELPPFDVLAQYALPGVGVLYDTDTGFHGISFATRDETSPAP